MRGDERGGRSSPPSDLAAGCFERFFLRLAASRDWGETERFDEKTREKQMIEKILMRGVHKILMCVL